MKNPDVYRSLGLLRFPGLLNILFGFNVYPLSKILTPEFISFGSVYPKGPYIGLPS